MKLQLLFVFASLALGLTPQLLRIRKTTTCSWSARRIDGSGAAPIDNVWIHIRGERIAAIGQHDYPSLAST